MTRTASCTCGQLRAICSGEPVRVSMCHCLECQKRSGSAFALTARWPSERVTVEGTATEYTRVGDEGSAATFRFCPTCGATVYFTSNAMPDMVAVPVGVFAEPSFPPPVVSVYGERRHPWIAWPSLSIEEYD